MKLILFLVLLSNCSSLEKERLELEKARLDLEKEKILFLKEKSNCGCCTEKISNCKTCSEKIILTEAKVKEKEPEKFLVYPEVKQDCEKISSPKSIDIWSLAKEGGWSFEPNKIKTGTVDSCDKEIVFYKEFSNTESYVAETQVPRTKKSSCTNNVLFHGKDKLYNLMIDKTAKENLSLEDQNRINKPELLKEIISYNNEGKLRSFYFECIPTDPKKNWDKCSCVLYASYKDGKNELISRMKAF
ncbi:MAG: hypothetical protein SFU98_15340 [Leptospiraceae bacterium]|nr:hypothetical protein [Leptospiraceae bacterium]